MAHTQTTMLTQLKGAPLSVLLALSAGCHTREDIMCFSGWSQNAVSQALNLLAEMGLAVRSHYRHWQIPRGVNIYSLLNLAPPSLPEPDVHIFTSTAPERSCHDLSAGRSLDDRSAAERSLDDLSAEQSSDDFSTPEKSFHDLSAEQSPDDFSTPEKSFHDLSAEQSSDDPSAEQSLDDSSAPERSLDDLSAEQSLDDFSTSERSRHDRSAPEKSFHDHSPCVVVDVDHHDSFNNHQQTTPNNARDEKIPQLAARLHALQPPFANPAAWLQNAPLDLVQGWLDHLDELDRDAIRAIRSQSAFIRAKVAANEPPPPSRHPQRRACPTCGKTYFDRDGLCLVCAGVVHT